MRRPAGELFGLKPSIVHYNKSMGVFGMTLTNGEKAHGGYSRWCDKHTELPKRINKIEVCFRQSE